MFRIVIEQFEMSQVEGEEPVQRGAAKVYEQSVPELDLKRVIDAINAKPRKPRVVKVKA